MLTVDLIRARRRGKKIVPEYLQDERFDNAIPLATTLIDVFEQAPGHSLDELDEMLKDVSGAEPDRLLTGGLIKLLKDRCEFDETTGAEASLVRETLFMSASANKSQLGIKENFDRDSEIAKAAESLSLTPKALESALFADLPGAQILRSLNPISPKALLQRYNLSLAQAVLFRASRVQIDINSQSAPRLRSLFRTIKFHRLMHNIEGSPSEGYRITLDGPMSLFESTQRYGIQLALFLPTLIAADDFVLRAELLWGKNKSKALFELTPEIGLVSTARDIPGDPEELASLERTFGKLQSPWVMRREATVFDLKGKGLFIPDAIFEHSETKQKVFFEVFGYWNRNAVFQRVELLERDFPHLVVLGVSKKLRVSEEVATEDFPGKILVYTSSISAHSLKQKLDDLCPQGP